MTARRVRDRADVRLRPLDWPVPLRVQSDREGRPVRVVRRRVVRRKGQPEAVLAIRETWRIDDEWWRAPVSRLYYEVVLEGGKLLTLYRDLRDGSWHEQ